MDETHPEMGVMSHSVNASSLFFYQKPLDSTLNFFKSSSQIYLIALNKASNIERLQIAPKAGQNPGFVKTILLVSRLKILIIAPDSNKFANCYESTPEFIK